MNRIRHVIVAALTFITIPSFAIENLSPDCEKILSGQNFFQISPSITINLTENQVLFRGKLSAFWETGMEGYIGWSLIDTFGEQTFSSMRDALFMLENDDHIFILNQSGEIQIAGFYSEFNRIANQTRSGFPLQVSLNHPRISDSREHHRGIIPTTKLEEHFFSESSAVVIRTYSQDRLQKLRDRLEPQIAAYSEHIKDPSRFLPVGNGKTYEKKFYEKSAEGQLIIEPREYENGSNHKEPTFRLFLRTNEGDYPLRYGMRIFLIDDQGQQLLDYVLRSDIGVDVFREREQLDGVYQTWLRATKAIVISRR